MITTIAPPIYYTTTQMPIITIHGFKTNGIRVGNASSDRHGFNFITGEYLPPCEPDRAEVLKIEKRERLENVVYCPGGDSYE